MNAAQSAREGGAALVAVLVVSLLVGGVAVTAWQYAGTRLAAARARIARVQAAWLARGTVRVAVAWFEADERGALIAPPGLAALERSLRRIDPDGDGTGPLWSDASGARRVRYRDAGGAPFRPPDGPAWEDRFVGTADGPDVLLDRAAVAARPTLVALEQALDPRGTHRIARLAFFGPRPGASPETLATVEAIVEQPRPPWGAMRAAARADAVRVEWDRPERALVVAGDLVIEGDAGWRRGEALVGGDLRTGGAIPAGWPGGIPWLGIDRPLRDDADGDGTADDADGDGQPDLAFWRSLPGDVPDPWWRARVAGAWPGIAASPASCGPAIPFGPRGTPPRPASKTAERSGLMVGCGPFDVEAVPPAWRRIARSGARGTVIAVESGTTPGLFLRDGEGTGRPLLDLMPARGALLLARRTGASGPLDLQLAGEIGALVIEGGAVIEVATAREAGAVPPSAVRDTGGEDRPGAVADDALDLAATGPSCDEWSVGPWRAGPRPEGPAGTGCPDRPAGFHGLLASEGAMTLRGPARIAGQLRAAGLRLDGTAGAAVVAADGAADPLVAGRPGPPGAPRVIPLRVRSR